MCTNQNISNIPFIMRGNLFLVHGHKKDLTHIKGNFHLLKYVVNLMLVSAILHHISLLRLLPKSYLKKVLFNPIFCALAPLIIFDIYQLNTSFWLIFEYLLHNNNYHIYLVPCFIIIHKIPINNRLLIGAVWSALPPSGRQDISDIIVLWEGVSTPVNGQFHICETIHRDPCFNNKFSSFKVYDYF